MNICQTRCTQQTFFKTAAVISVVTAVALAVIASTAVTGVTSTALYAAGGTLIAAVAAGLVATLIRRQRQFSAKVQSMRENDHLDFENAIIFPGNREITHSPSLFAKLFEWRSNENAFVATLIKIRDKKIVLKAECIPDADAFNATFLVQITKYLKATASDLDTPSPTALRRAYFHQSNNHYHSSVLKGWARITFVEERI